MQSLWLSFWTRCSNTRVSLHYVYPIMFFTHTICLFIDRDEHTYGVPSQRSGFPVLFDLWTGKARHLIRIPWPSECYLLQLIITFCQPYGQVQFWMLGPHRILPIPAFGMRMGVSCGFDNLVWRTVRIKNDTLCTWDHNYNVSPILGSWRKSHRMPIHVHNFGISHISWW